MEFTANQIAAFLQGKVEGDGEVKVSNVSKIEEGTPGTLSFLANAKYTSYLYSTGASIVLVNHGFVPEKKVNSTLIFVDDAYQAFASLLELVASTLFEQKSGIEQPSFIDPTAIVGENVYVGAFAYIGKNAKLGKNVKVYPQVYIGDNVTIGDEVTLYAGSRIYQGCQLGSFVTIHSGAVIGADGFGFAPTDTANYKKIPQIGNVILEDYVEIGSNTTVDRATMGSTIIRKGVKLDNLIQIGHNVEIGENTVMAAQSGIAGSTKVGKNCMMGGQVGLAGHITIADEVKFAAKSGVSGNIKEKGKIMMGAPAFDVVEYRKAYIHFRNLGKFDQKLRELKKELSELKKKLSE